MPDIESIKTILKNKKERIVSVPENTAIDKKHLGELTNKEFIIAFRSLQQLVASLYDEIIIDPIQYGYPLNPKQARDNTSLNCRLTDIMFIICRAGNLVNGELTVDKKTFKNGVKIHKKSDLIIELLSDSDFIFNNYDNKNSGVFSVQYPGDPNLLHVLNAYAQAQDFNTFSPCFARGVYESLSHRWLEDPHSQKYEPHFLVEMDRSSKELQDIQYWLHDIAKRYGYTVPLKQKHNYGCVCYEKGPKIFLSVGEKKINEKNTVYVKINFRKAFETHMDKLNELHSRFPDFLGNNDFACTFCFNVKNIAGSVCRNQIDYVFKGTKYKDCSYSAYYLYNPNLEDMPFILELFCMENKIKTP